MLEEAQKSKRCEWSWVSWRCKAKREEFRALNSALLHPRTALISCTLLSALPFHVQCTLQPSRVLCQGDLNAKPDKRIALLVDSESSPDVSLGISTLIAMRQPDTFHL